MEAWAAFFLLAAVALFGLELFLPSAGLLTISSLVCLVIGVGCLFSISPTAGAVGTIAAFLVIPAAAGLAIKVFPNTPMGRWLILVKNQPAQAKTIKYDKHRDAAPDELVGVEGEAVTDLRPVGTCRLNGQRIECLSEGGMIEAGARVRVTSVQGIEVKVRAV